MAAASRSMLAAAAAMAAAAEEKFDHTVRVMARFRPESSSERRSSASDRTFSFRFSKNLTAVELYQQEAGRPALERHYTFDRVFGPATTQEEVFSVMARSTVDDVVKGFNGTLFAYGQTGSGKTFSMFGAGDRRDLRGVIPRSAEYLFDQLQRAEDVVQVTIKCSFLEIYKERVRDLLNPSQGPGQLRVRETPHGAVKVFGLVEEFVASPAGVLKLISAGNRHRHTSRTVMNEASSRSHSVLTLTVTARLRDKSIRVSKLNLADLAGSERVDKSGLVGDTLSEAKKINQSLSALGNCINALTDKSRSHVPFRDSKLTYLLKDSLGGNTKTSLLVTCSPHVSNSDETLSTLAFAMRAKHVHNSVRVNRQLSVAELQSLVTRLRRQLSESRARIRQLQNERGVHVPGGSGGGGTLPRGGPASSSSLPASSSPRKGKKGHSRRRSSSGTFADDQALAYAAAANAASGGPRRGFQTLPADPQQAAELYSALGPAAMTASGLSEEEAALMAQAERTLRGQKVSTMPAAHTAEDVVLADALDRYTAYEEEFGDMQAQFVQDDESKFIVDPGGRTVVGGGSRVTVRQKLLQDAGLAGAAAPLRARPGFYTSGGGAGSPAGSDADSSSGVLDRARQAIKRSVESRSSARPMEQQRPASGALAAEDEAARLRTKLDLREDVEKAKKRRDGIRAAQKRREEAWRRHEAADRDTRRVRRPSDLRVLAPEPVQVPDREQEEYSDSSPIPPPPAYDPPMEVGRRGRRAPAAAAAAAGAGPVAASGSASSSASSAGSYRPIARRRTGEYRVEVGSRQLGFIDVGDPGVRLEELRLRIVSELDGVPESFVFLRAGIPIGLKQERKRTIEYISEDGVLRLRGR